MYVFDRYVCFYSNVFGYLKNKSIPLQVCWLAHAGHVIVCKVVYMRLPHTGCCCPRLQDVVAVKKKTHFRFPNSVEVSSRPPVPPEPCGDAVCWPLF